MGLWDWFRSVFLSGGNELRVHDDLQHLLNGHMDFLQTLHVRGSLAPLAASMDDVGKVTGQAVTAEPGREAAISVVQVLEHYAKEFRAAFLAGRIRASAIFFHGSTATGSVTPARTAHEANAIVAWLEHASGQSVQAVIGYTKESLPSGVLRWRYGPPVFTERSASPQTEA